MSSTSLILLAMYSTVNVVGPATGSLTHANQVFLVALLLAAASLAVFGMLLTSMPQQRSVRKGPSLPRLQRRITGPGVRRR